jgi:hypothetical protein
MIVFLFVRSEPVAWDRWGLVMGSSQKTTLISLLKLPIFYTLALVNRHQHVA